MTKYLISFDDGTMDIAEEEFEEVGNAAHAVMKAAQDSGVWVFGGGLHSQQAAIVATDGSITNGPFPETKAVLGGFSIVDVSTRDEALTWAARFAKACRCPQEVREIMDDPDA
jgi:hypothetical protein